MKEKLITRTLGFDSGPVVSICIGHVNATQFNSALKAEGFFDSAWIYKKDIYHEY